MLVKKLLVETIDQVHNLIITKEMILAICGRRRAPLGGIPRSLFVPYFLWLSSFPKDVNALITPLNAALAARALTTALLLKVGAAIARQAIPIITTRNRLAFRIRCLGVT